MSADPPFANDQQGCYGERFHAMCRAIQHARSCFPPGTALALALLSGCVSTLGPVSESHVDTACGQRTVERLYFGTNTADGPLSAVQWQSFVEAEVTPLFPQGLTVFEAQGQWRNERAVVEREPSMVLEIIHDGSAAERTSIRSIIEAYKARYRQQSVLSVTSTATACF